MNTINTGMEFKPFHVEGGGRAQNEFDILSSSLSTGSSVSPKHNTVSIDAMVQREMSRRLENQVGLVFSQAV